MTSILIKKTGGVSLRVFSFVGGGGLRGKMFENHCRTGLAGNSEQGAPASGIYIP
jgi:hypothetical protein